MEKLEVIDIDKLGSNPYVSGLAITARIVDMHPVTYAECVPFIKVFTTGELKKKVYNLPPPAQRLLWFITLNLDSGKDYINLNQKHYMSTNDIKAPKTVRDAINILWLAKFIAPCPNYKSVFWINPTFFFCGSRPNKFPDKLTVVAPAHQRVINIEVGYK